MKGSGNVKAVLEEYFKHTPKPNKAQLEALGKLTNRRYSTIYQWFLKRRNHVKVWKRKVPLKNARRNSSVCYKSEGKSSSEEDEALRSHRLQLQYNIISKRAGKSVQGTEKILPDSPSACNVSQEMSQILPPNLETQKFKVSSASSNEINTGLPYFTSKENECLIQSENDPACQILLGLSSHEISVLEKIFNEMPYPSRGDIARLASQFVKEQDKRIEISRWFDERRAAAKSSKESASEMF